MRRHVIIGRFGPDDKTRVPKALDEVASTLQLVTESVSIMVSAVHWRTSRR